MTKEEKRTVLAVFGGILQNRSEDMQYFLGSETIGDMQELYSRLKYEDYCSRHGLSSWKDMEPDDYIQYQAEVDGIDY